MTKPVLPVVRFLFFLILIISVQVMLTPLKIAALNEASAWSAEDIETAIFNGFVPDYLQTNYTRAISRADFCAIAVAVYEQIIGKEIDERAVFGDTDNVNVQKIGGIGVASGMGDGLFFPDVLITREQAAVILAKLLSATGMTNIENASAYSDNDDISLWAVPSVTQVRAAGIMVGVGNNTFLPKDNFSLEQSIVSLLKLYNAVSAYNQEKREKIQAYIDDVVKLVNHEREKHRLPPLENSELLNTAAAVRASELEELFSHNRPNGKSGFTVLNEHSIQYSAAAENIAGGYITPEEVFEEWMNSFGHRNNILSNNMNRIGIGIHVVNNNSIYWVQLFTGD